ncbi:MAG TPA: hypothetical protein VNV37_10165 [Solirubrobacteraceae bacterium]|nr:hypothetical protein [Solirubrobacteraceae bacterium]
MLAGGLAFGCGSAWAVASPVSWASPVAVDDQPPFASPTEVSGVACPSTELCVAVDNVGDVLSTTNPTGGTAAWRSARVAEDFTAVACPSTELCVAIGGHTIATSTDPTGGAAAWSIVHVGRELAALSCASARLCVATNEHGGDVWTSTDPAGGAGAWSEATVEERALSGISCPSVKLCVGVDDGDDVVTSTDPTGGTGAWTATQVAEGRTIFDVSCASEELCVATDNYGEVLTSTDPTGGAGAWSAAKVSEELLTHVSCAPWGLCIAMGGNEVLASTEPAGGAAAWSSTSFEAMKRYEIEGASCPAANLCVLTDSDSGVITSTEPAGGAAAWTIVPVGVGSSSLSGISCASLELCVLIDEAGNVVTSTDPTGGAGAWSEAHVDEHKLDGVSCPTVGFCVAVDGAGDILVSTDPTGGLGAWSIADVDGTLPLEHVSCASASLCVATDREGGVLVSTDPAGGAGAWSRSQMEGRALGGVACPSEHLCVVTQTNAGQVLVSKEPTSGAGSWAVQDDAGVGSEISCPSVSLCVTAAGRKGLAVISWGDPTTGGWSVASRFESVNGLSGVSCTPEGTCVATSFGGNGSSGNVIATPDPTGGKATWIASNLYGSVTHPSSRFVTLPLEYYLKEVAGIACVKGGVCIVGNINGHLIVGDPQRATALENIESPSIIGKLAAGNTVTCATGTWTGEPAPTFTYRWLREGLPIAGASAETYIVQVGDAGENLECEVTATNAGEHRSTFSESMPVAATEPGDPTPPTVSGTPSVGETLTCSNGVWTGGPVTLTVQWRRGGVTIPGATGSSYRVQAGDAGESLACEVTATNSAGHGSATSVALLVPAKEQPGGGSPTGGGSEPGGGHTSGSSGGGVSNAFTLIGVTSMARRGAVELTLSLPGPGTLQIVGTIHSAGAPGDKRNHRSTLVIARLHLTIAKGGQMVVIVRPDVRAKRLLSERGALKATVELTYTPAGGEPGSIVQGVMFRTTRSAAFRLTRRHPR